MARREVTSTVCAQCKGHFWNDDSSKRQQAVREAFPGKKLPNDCVNGEGNGMFPEIKCPYK